MAVRNANESQADRRIVQIPSRSLPLAAVVDVAAAAAAAAVAVAVAI